jgi:hypothetical protein
METNECVCTEKNEIIHNTKNCWEYYFDQYNVKDNFTILNSLQTGGLSYNDNHMFMNPNNFIELKNKFYASFKLKKDILETTNDFYEKKIKDKITLGVQIRLTDMKHHLHVYGLDTYISKINEILIDNPNIEQIFVATDDNVVIDGLKSNLKIPIIYYENMFRADKDNLHLNPYDRYNSTRPRHMYMLGLECLYEILALTKCDYFLKAHISAVSSTAVILSENIKKVYTL